jgi:alkylated DNA repair protein alkB family protein 8
LFSFWNLDTLLSFQETSKVWPTGLKLKKNFISLGEEEKLLFFTHTQQSESQTSQLKHRTVKHYGFEFLYGSNKVDKNPLSSGIPVEMEPLVEKFMEFGLVRPNQLTVNHYVPGQGIPLHTDTHSSFEDGIISVSLGSDIVMDFKNNKGGECVSITLPRRSCLIMTNESR